MERLTVKKRYGGGIPHDYWSSAKKDVVVQRLGEYEDIGLEPEEIRALLRSSGMNVDVNDSE